MTPHFSAICLTFGRPSHLEEAIACFLAQDYPGPKELIVLNTFPRQQLQLSAPNVFVHNLATRPPSLGEARNIAIGLAKGSHLVTWDDDDLFLPTHLSTIAKHCANHDWIWLSRQFYSEGGKIRRVVQGSANVVIFTKNAWEKVGGYRPMGTGEDRDFVGRLTSTTPGQRIDIQPEECSFIYCWGNGVYHISGLGDDAPGTMASYRRAERALESAIKHKKIATGTIVLTPKLKRDYAGMAAEHVSKLNGRALPPAVTSRAGSIGIVQLGRYGDIINILPICRHIAERFKKPHLVVSREFAQLLEGVSYVEPYPVDLGYGQLTEALALAQRAFERVINAQIWGLKWRQERLCDAYNRESWRNAGFLHKFDDRNWKPVFDRRNEQREQALYNKLAMKGQPMLLVALSGHSSPFPLSDELFAAINTRFGSKCRVVDLRQVKAERIFDLLGLMDRAGALVTIDSSLLHLAAGSSVPVVALTNPTPWLGSAPRANCVARIPYFEADGLFTPVLEAIEKALATPHLMETPIPPITEPGQARIFHAVERHVERGGARARKERAQRSWQALYAAGVIPRHLQEPYPRNSRELGDRRGLPFLKDVLAHGMADAENHDIVVLTNDDIFLHSELPKLLRCHVALHGACSSFRIDYRRKVPNKNDTGRDMFAFTKGWLVEHWADIPDFLLGAPEWDWCLAALIRKTLGIASTRANIEQVMAPAEIPTGFIFHQRHASRWQLSANMGAAGTKHNQRLFAQWLSSNLPDFYRSAAPPSTPANTAVRQTFVVRRTGAIGDALAATCVATALMRRGHAVTFQCDPSIHAVLQYHSHVRDLKPPTGAAHIDLDGAYENHPGRQSLHFAQMFTEEANKQLSRFGVQLPATNYAPRLICNHLDDSLRILERFPKPWIMVCPQSNSWANRTVPAHIWSEVAKRVMHGSVLWLGQQPAPEAIYDLSCQSILSMVRYLACADLLVTVDTGPMHVAAALGKPVVAIEQASSPELHLSDQRDFTVVRPALDCLNCQQNICPKDASYPPCQQIDPAQVASEVNRKLRQYEETVSCTIAIYKPPIERLNKCLSHVLPQVSEVVIAGDMETPWPLEGLINDPKIICVRKNGVKTGYGKKQNFAMRHSSGKYVLQLNDDCYLEQGVVDHLLQLIKQDRVGMVSHLLRYPNGTIQYAGKNRQRGSMGFGHLDHKKLEPSIKTVVEQESICGASVLVRREAFYRADGFDEDYYLYADDDDLAMAIRKQGYKLLFTPHALGIHEEHCSSKITPQWEKILQGSAARFADKWRPYFLKNSNPKLIGRFA